MELARAAAVEGVVGGLPWGQPHDSMVPLPGPGVYLRRISCAESTCSGVSWSMFRGRGVRLTTTHARRRLWMALVPMPSRRGPCGAGTGHLLGMFCFSGHVAVWQQWTVGNQILVRFPSQSVYCRAIMISPNALVQRMRCTGGAVVLHIVGPLPRGNEFQHKDLHH